MITCRVVREGVLGDPEPFDPEAVRRALGEGCHLWVDVTDPGADELAVLQGTFGLHELSIEDSLRWGQRSKLEFYADYVFVVLHALRLDERDQLVDSEVHLFAAVKGYVITVRREPMLDIEPVVKRIRVNRELAGEGIGFPLYVILDEIVDGYLAVVDRFEDLSDDIEDRVFEEEGEGDVQEEIFRLKRNVVRFRRLANPVREVVDLLHESAGVVTPTLRPYYRDVLDHVIRASEFVDNIRDLLTSALESQLAQVSNRLNVVMKHLTAWAGIILVPTLIAGIYGMNFHSMPELSWAVGYPLALGLMLASAGILYLVFKRRDWL
ncbi:MAG: magnesium/cobalt transporter CorA [Actinomycetota bacterium]